MLPFTKCQRINLTKRNHGTGILTYIWHQWLMFMVFMRETNRNYTWILNTIKKNQPNVSKYMPVPWILIVGFKNRGALVRKQKKLFRTLKHLNHPLSFSMATKKLKKTPPNVRVPRLKGISLSLCLFKFLSPMRHLPQWTTDVFGWIFLLSTTQENAKNTAQVRLEITSRIVRGKNFQDCLKPPKWRLGNPD